MVKTGMPTRRIDTRGEGKIDGQPDGPPTSLVGASLPDKIQFMRQSLASKTFNPQLRVYTERMIESMRILVADKTLHATRFKAIAAEHQEVWESLPLKPDAAAYHRLVHDLSADSWAVTAPGSKRPRSMEEDRDDVSPRTTARTGDGVQCEAIYPSCPNAAIRPFCGGTCKRFPECNDRAFRCTLCSHVFFSSYWSKKTPETGTRVSSQGSADVEVRMSIGETSKMQSRRKRRRSSLGGKKMATPRVERRTTKRV